MALSVEQQRVKNITDSIERSYANVKQMANAINGLISMGRATCTEVKAYNVLALSIYNTQKGMLAQLRAAGERGVPELPPAPTWFAWKGVAGNEAWRVDCGSSAPTLSGILAEAMASTQTGTPNWVSPDQIVVVTSDRSTPVPSQGVPAFADLASLNLNGLRGPLGLEPLTLALIIGGIVLTVTAAIAIPALAGWFSTNKIQEETSKRVEIQSDDYKKYVEARMGCYSNCLKDGGTVERCQQLCTGLVTKPEYKDFGPKADGWSTLEQIGAATLAAGALYVGYRYYKKKQAEA